METGEARHAQQCHCGKLTRMQTSWTTSKPRRRFLVCPKTKWFDAEMCERSKSLIPGLLRKIDRVEKENAKIRAKSRILWPRGWLRGVERDERPDRASAGSGYASNM
ncbi:unnamed protein product [Prunus armeniaca]